MFSRRELDVDLDLFSAKSRKVGACGKLFAGYRQVKLHRNEQFGFRTKPILPVISMRVSTGLENLKGASRNQIVDVLCVCSKSS
jgi:hypothetical protein